MPGWNCLERRADEELFGITIGERHVRALGGLEKDVQRHIHELSIVGVVGRNAVKHTVRIVKRQVEGRGADEGGEQRNFFVLP